MKIAPNQRPLNVRRARRAAIALALETEREKRRMALEATRKAVDATEEEMANYLALVAVAASTAVVDTTRAAWEDDGGRVSDEQLREGPGSGDNFGGRPIPQDELDEFNSAGASSDY